MEKATGVVIVDLAEGGKAYMPADFCPLLFTREKIIPAPDRGPLRPISPSCRSCWHFTERMIAFAVPGVGHCFADSRK